MFFLNFPKMVINNKVAECAILDDYYAFQNSDFGHFGLENHKLL